MSIRHLSTTFLAVLLAGGCGSAGAKKADGGDAAPGTGGGGGGPSGDGGGGGSSGGGGTSSASGDAGGAAPDAASGDVFDGVGADAPPDAAADGFVGDAPRETPPPVSGSPYRALAIATGTIQTCALLDNHRIKCWGVNGYGELGLGDTKPRGASPTEMGDALPFVDLGTGRTAVAVAAGRYHTCAILDDGGVKCWGLSVFIGLPDDGNVARGDNPGEMGDKLPALDFGPGHRARLIGASSTTSCAVFEDGTAQCWADQPSRTPHAVSLGTTARAIQLSPQGHNVIALFDDGSVANGLSSSTAVGRRGAENATYLAGSETNGCVVFENGNVHCLGPSAAPPETVPGFRALGISLSSSCGLFVDGSVRCFRAPSACDRQLPGTTYWCPAAHLADSSVVVALGQPAAAISTASYNHMCVVLADGGVKCWSLNDDCRYDNGQLGGCEPPEAAKLDPNLGASVDIVLKDGARAYGAWRPVDLGKHP